MRTLKDPFLDSKLPADTDDLITELSTRPMSTSQRLRVKTLVPEEGALDIHAEIESQYILIQTLRSEILNPNGSIRNGVEVKDLQAILSQFNSFMTLYLRSMEHLDRDRQLSEIEAAVTKTISSCSKEVQDEYLRMLTENLL